MLKGKPVNAYLCLAGLFMSILNSGYCQDSLKTIESLPIAANKVGINVPSVQSVRPIKTTEVKVINSEDTLPIKLQTSVPFLQRGRSGNDQIYADNFLLAIPTRKFCKEITSKEIEHCPILISKHLTQTISLKAPLGFEGHVRIEASMDWLPLVVVCLLFLFAWIKLLYQKFVYQVIASLVDYQVSVRMFRERNVLFRNMSVSLFFIFSVNAAIFVLYLLQYNQVDFSLKYTFITFFIISVCVAFIYQIKSLFCRLLGHLFLVQDEFEEYVYNLNLFNKGIGLFLFPVVVAYPYILDSLKPYLLGFGIIFVGVIYILRLARGVQIILRKEVSIFYLILYLCAVEILPVLLVVKVSGTLIRYV